MKDLSLYIHIPFCKTLCLYCNFLTFAHKNKWIPDYINALKQEIEQKAAKYKGYTIETVYFGGGTPSLIDPTYIDDILKVIRKNFHVRMNPEISIECNPESTTREKLLKYKMAGITRISLGIQNFDKKILFRIARPHDFLAIQKALEAIKNSGFQNVGADFIMGLPCQTFEHFTKQLKQILELGLQHLSFYFLSYDTKKIDLFKADCPDESTQIRMYRHLTRKMKKCGYIHYEVSNYAKPGYECRHNLRYWKQKEYLGFGLGAHSYIDRVCVENERDFDHYLENPVSINEKVTIDDEVHRMDHILLQLRTHRGIDLKNYKRLFGENEDLQKKAGAYISSMQLIIEKDHLKATEEGFLILDRITEDLVTPMR